MNGDWLASACKSFARLLCAIVTLTAFKFLVLYPNVSAAPRIRIDSEYWNFGIVTNANYVSHDYSISNAGDAPLIINSLVSTCNVCLHADIGATNLPPGATTYVHAVLDLQILPAGSIGRAILMTCNDPQDPTIVLDLNGVSVPAYQVTPVSPLLDLTTGPNPVSAQITPLFHLRAPLSRFFCLNTNIQISNMPQTNGGCLLEIKAGKAFPQSNEPVTITIRTTDTNDLPCTFQVFVRNAPSLELIPRQLTFPPQAGEQTRILWVKQHGPSPLSLLDAVLPVDRFHCEIDPDPGGYNYTIYVTLWQQSPIVQTNTLVLKMIDAAGQKKEIRVPVFVQK